MNHATYLTEVAGVTPPLRLRALMMHLAGEEEIVAPDARQGLFPLVIPLSRHSSGPVTGLLRWPTAPKTMPMPLVRTGPHGLSLLAASVDQYLLRLLGEQEVDEEPYGALLEAANQDEVLFQPGDVLKTGLPLKAWLLLKVGGIPELYEDLSIAHEAKGDHLAAIITAERGVDQCPDWGRPWAFKARLCTRLGKHQEAQQMALSALLEPLWTLGAPFAEIAELANWKAPYNASAYRTLAEDESKPPLDRAAHWLDVAAIEGGWEGVGERIAPLYEAAGLTALAGFVRG